MKHYQDKREMISSDVSKIKWWIKNQVMDQKSSDGSKKIWSFYVLMIVH